MTFHLIDPKAGFKSANSAQYHFNTPTTAWVYFSGLNCPSCVVHVCTIISVSLTTHKFYLLQATPGARNLYYIQNAKCLRSWSDLREIPLRVTTQNVRLYEIHMDAKYGSNSSKGEEMFQLYQKVNLCRRRTI